MAPPPSPTLRLGAGQPLAWAVPPGACRHACVLAGFARAKQRRACAGTLSASATPMPIACPFPHCFLLDTQAAKQVPSPGKMGPSPDRSRTNANIALPVAKVYFATEAVDIMEDAGIVTLVAPHGRNGPDPLSNA